MKKTYKENVRVIVRPYDGYGHDFKTLLDICKDIDKQIERHIDDVGETEIDWDANDYCEFCGNPWEINNDATDENWLLGEPLCCKKAQEEWRKNEKT